MITKPTTLILGAGASAPFGFPTGYELLRRVMEWANINAGCTNPNLFLGFNRAEIDEFREALRRSGTTSVDAFLEHRPEFIPIGKEVMSMALIQCEHEPHLFKRDGKSWYEYLFNRLNARFEEFDKNQLNILTFNYDRSLEHFLFTALKHTSGKSEEECANKIKSIPIIHLQGDLGALPYTGVVSARPYNSNISLEALNIAARRIKIIHEGIEKEPQFAQAQKILSDSDVICFLGFGYHPLNMERLGFKSHSMLPEFDITGNIYGSSFGLTHAECNQISDRYRINIGSPQFDCSNLDVLQYLRETGVLHGN